MGKRWAGWMEFREAALDSLRRGTGRLALLRLGQKPVLQLVVQAAFANAESWEILGKWHDGTMEASEPRYSVALRIWRQDLDLFDIDAPGYDGPDYDEPGYEEYITNHLPEVATIEETQFDMPAKPIDDLLAELSSLTLPILPHSDEIGNDGVLYELQMGGMFQASRFLWWCDGPPAWKGLIRIAARLCEHLVRERERISGTRG